MTPAEYDAWKKNVPAAIGLAPKLPTRYMIALDEIRTEDRKAAAAEREQRERDAGLPQAQAAHAARVQEIHDARVQTVAECREAERAAFQLEQEQLAELGPCPSLESLEAKV
jgi:hypothetical protein